MALHYLVRPALGAPRWRTHSFARPRRSCESKRSARAADASCGTLVNRLMIGHAARTLRFDGSLPSSHRATIRNVPQARLHFVRGSIAKPLWDDADDTPRWSPPCAGSRRHRPGDAAGHWLLRTSATPRPRSISTARCAASILLAHRPARVIELEMAASGGDLAGAPHGTGLAVRVCAWLRDHARPPAQAAAPVRDDAVRPCLYAPETVLRQATSARIEQAMGDVRAGTVVFETARVRSPAIRGRVPGTLDRCPGDRVRPRAVRYGVGWRAHTKAGRV